MLLNFPFDSPLSYTLVRHDDASPVTSGRNVTDGKRVIGFAAKGNHAEINGIEILKP